MPFTRPTLSQLRQQAAAELAAELPGADAQLRFTNLRVMMTVQAGFAHGHFGYLDWIARQAVPWTAVDEALAGWAALKDVTAKPATKAAGVVTFTGAPGSIIPATTGVTRSDGVRYTVTADSTIGGGGSVAVPIRAADVGSAGNASVGVAMTLDVIIAGVTSNGAVSTEVAGGADVEGDDALRTRMLQVYRAPPQGGAEGDYLKWALECDGVTRAWCVRNGFGPGTVVVFIMLDEVRATGAGFPAGSNGTAADEPRGSPATGDQLVVADYIYSRQPTTALVQVCSPVPDAIAFTIDGVPGGLQADVEAALDDLFTREATPGGTVKADGSAGGTVPYARLWAAVASVMRLSPFDIVAPTDDLVAAGGHIATRGVVTFT